MAQNAIKKAAKSASSKKCVPPALVRPALSRAKQRTQPQTDTQDRPTALGPKHGARVIAPKKKKLIQRQKLVKVRSLHPPSS